LISVTALSGNCRQRAELAAEGRSETDISGLGIERLLGQTIAIPGIRE
jgi:hypothetical protein